MVSEESKIDLHSIEQSVADKLNNSQLNLQDQTSRNKHKQNHAQSKLFCPEYTHTDKLLCNSFILFKR